MPAARHSIRNKPVTVESSTGRGSVSLLEAFRPGGGTATADIVGRSLAHSQTGVAASLAGLIHSGQAFGLQRRGSLWMPMFQFNTGDLSISAAPQAVTAELPERRLGWAVALWFAMPNIRLDRRMPVDLSASNFDAVFQAPQAFSSIEHMVFIQRRLTQDRAVHA